MSIYNFIKNILGIPNGNDRSSDEYHRSNDSFNDQDTLNGVLETDEGRNHEELWHDIARPSIGMGFNVLSDPIEMQRYFEYQMNEAIKSFSDMFEPNDKGPTIFGFGGGNPSIIPPQQSDDLEVEPSKGNLRDQFLKPGYERPNHTISKKKSDTDLDGRVNIGDIDSILKNEPRKDISLYQPNRNLQIRSFGQSVSSRRIQRPDGSVEMHRTVRDQDGNEETTVTRQLGDKQYTVTTRRGKNGKEEKIEDMINIDEKELSKFVDTWERPSQPQIDLDKWSLFDKFFK